jgi:hypothetical protein
LWTPATDAPAPGARAHKAHGAEARATAPFRARTPPQSARTLDIVILTVNYE